MDLVAKINAVTNILDGDATKIERVQALSLAFYQNAMSNTAGAEFAEALRLITAVGEFDDNPYDSPGDVVIIFGKDLMGLTS